MSSSRLVVLVVGRFFSRILWLAALGALSALATLACSDGGDASPGDADGEVAVFAGQTAPVEIFIDGEGLPHLFAQNDLDLFYAQGWRLAQERLYQLDYTRRRATGRLAEVFGASKRDSDRLMRTLRLERIAEASLELMRANRREDFELLRAFVAGINRRVAEVRADPAELPPEYGPDGFDIPLEDFTERDIMSIGQMLVFSFSSTLEFDLLASALETLVPEFLDIPIFEAGGQTYSMIHNLPEHHADIGQPGTPWIERRRKAAPRAAAHILTDADQAELARLVRAVRRYQQRLDTGEGSNGFAVNAAHSDNGRSILVNDSHAGYSAPSNMFLSHINSADAGGRFDAAGYAFPGGPGVQVGTTRTVAWGATTAFADVMDVWDVPVQGDSALIGGVAEPILTERETIRVRRADGGFDEEPWEVRRVEGRGVLFPEEILPIPKLLFASGEVLVNSPAFEPTDEMSVYLDFARMRAMDDFESAVSRQRAGMQNWMAATADQIRFRAHGLVPDRGPAAGRPRAYRVLDGRDASTFWTGAFLPDERLPHLDGSQPFLVTANNDPWGHTADNDPTNDEFYYGSFFSPGLRATRLSLRLAEELAKGPLSVQQAKALQLDDYSLFAEGLVPILAEAVAKIGADASLAAYVGRTDLDAALATLNAWDRRFRRDSAEAALFRLFLAFLEKRTLGDEFSLVFEDLDDAQPVTMAKFALLAYVNDIDSLLDGQRDAHLVGALSDALAERETRGGAALTWGELHRAVFDAPDGRVVVETAKDGDDSSPNVSQSHCWRNGAIRPYCEASAGSVYRNVFTFAPDGSVIVEYHSPLSGRGELADWTEGVYRRMPWTRAEVEAAAVERFTLEPPRNDLQK